MPDDLRGPNIMHVRASQDAAPYLRKANAIVLAVKPQIMDEVTKSIAPFTPKDVLILSVAAGRSIASFESIFGSQQPIVRSIPNLGAQANESMTPAIANKNVGEAQRDLAEKLLKSIGVIDWIKDEDLMHAAAAITASGPGFLAHFMETLAQAAIAQGIDAVSAEQYARQMIIGSAAVLKADANLTSEQFRKRVTSPNGMTEAGLKILMAKLPDLMKETIEAAQRRSRELGT